VGAAAGRCRRGAAAGHDGADPAGADQLLAATTFHFKHKSRLDEAKLKAQLVLAGYQHVSQVVSPGEYAVRGGLIDLFPMGSPVPYRVDLFGDEVDSIRTFDPDSQRSLYPVPEVRLLPGREFPLDDAARTAFRARWREKIEGDPTRARLYKDMAQGLAGGGIEYYLPLFFEQTATVFDYFGAAGGHRAARRGRRRAGALLDRHPRAPPLPAA
jgi:transcription-repair coupling factor (superfamily II helicase)